MKKLFTSIFSKPQQFKKLNLCAHHLKKDKNGASMVNIMEPIPYSTDYCITCKQDICYSCSQTHVTQHCQVQCKYPSNSVNTIKNLGQGVLKSFNLGQVIKVDLRNIKCICGKPLTKGAAICAACGMACCSQQCHKQWQKLGNCKFLDNFYNIPEGFNMRSILYENIQMIQKSKAKQWIVTNKSSPTMICCYATSMQPFVFLQRGFRNYGIPNPQILAQMQPQARNLDYHIHFDRRCDCNCKYCQLNQCHSATNCQRSCLNFDLQFMKLAFMKAKNHKQCTCSCQFCRSGIIFSSHRFIDCMPFCQRSEYTRDGK